MYEEQVDDQMTGSISKENFLAAAQRLGLADTVGVELAFTFAQLLEGRFSVDGFHGKDGVEIDCNHIECQGAF